MKKMKKMKKNEKKIKKKIYLKFLINFKFILI